MTTIDKSLFGIKDFGEMTLLEFVELYDNIYINCLSKPIDSNYDKLDHTFTRLSKYYTEPYNKSAINKLNNMRAMINDTEHKYGVEFELSLECAGSKGCVFQITPRIDGVALRSTYCMIYYNPTRGIFYINDAHTKHTHTRNYAEFKANMTRITEELIATTMHPRRLIRHLELGGEIEDF